MDTQFVLRVIGIAALVVSGIFAVLAVHYYLTRDIRAVMDDLSGKTRARGVAGVRRSAAIDRRRETTRRSAASPVEAAAERPATAERPVRASNAAPVALLQVDDEPETMVEADDDFAAGSQGASYQQEAVPLASAQASGATADRPTFRVTRRVVHMSATQVIAVSEESGQ